MMDLTWLSQFVYIELTIGIIVVTMVINKLFGLKYYLNPKWLTLAVAIFGGVVHWLTHEDSSLWTIIVSFGIAVLGYDYFVKVLKDKFVNNKNPLV